VVSADRPESEERDLGRKPVKRASEVAMDEYARIRDQVDYAVRPFIKIRVYMPEGVSEDEFKSLEGDEEFEKRVERLALEYLLSRRK